MTTYIISTGNGNGMFTLNELEVAITEYGINEKTRYIKNLSRDWDTAISKAKSFLSADDKLEGTKTELNEWGDADKYTHLIYEPSSEQIAKWDAEKAKRAAEKAKLDAEWEKTQAERKAEHDALVDVPVTEQRIKIEGTIQNTYWKDSQWGGSTRVFILDDRGFKLNGAEPKKSNWKEGDKVSFYAKINVSDDDPKFGFYKRPTKIVLNNRGEWKWLKM